MTSEISDAMMNATGITVVHVLSGPTRHTLRRSGRGSIWRLGIKPSLPSQQYACLDYFLSHTWRRMVASDRREFQRLRLSKPILTLIDGESALMLDIGVGGAFLEHYGEMQPGHRFRLSFRWQGADVVFMAEVARSMIVRTPGGDGRSIVSHTGVRFIE